MGTKRNMENDAPLDVATYSQCKWIEIPCDHGLQGKWMTWSAYVIGDKPHLTCSYLRYPRAAGVVVGCNKDTV